MYESAPCQAGILLLFFGGLAAFGRGLPASVAAMAGGPGDVMRLIDDAQASGLRVTVTSGFRSNRQQGLMYNAWVQGGQRGNPVARPGHSSHNSGQAIDISTGRMSAAQRNQLGGIAGKDGLPYAGARDNVHFGGGFGIPIDPQLVIENNAHPNPDRTIVDGGVTTVNVTDSRTQIDTENSTIIPIQITPIDLQQLPLPLRRGAFEGRRTSL